MSESMSTWSCLCVCVLLYVTYVFVYAGCVSIDGKSCKKKLSWGMMPPCLVSFGVFVNRQKSQLSEERKLCTCPSHTEMLFCVCVHMCVCVCVCSWCGRWGVPVIKSSVRADQDPVNQAACERMRAWWLKKYESSSPITLKPTKRWERDDEQKGEREREEGDIYGRSQCTSNKKYKTMRGYDTK